MKIEAVNLRKGREGYMEGFGEDKEKGNDVIIILKRKRKSK